MQFIINGATYEAASIERVTGVDALELPRQAGIGLQSLAKRLEELARLGYDDAGNVCVLPEGADGIDGNAVVDSEPHLRALLAFLWLSRRMDGEKRLTFEDACSFPFASLQVVNDEPDEAPVEEPDPTAAPGAPDESPDAA